MVKILKLRLSFMGRETSVLYVGTVRFTRASHNRCTHYTTSRLDQFFIVFIAPERVPSIFCLRPVCGVLACRPPWITFQFQLIHAPAGSYINTTFPFRMEIFTFRCAKVLCAHSFTGLTIAVRRMHICLTRSQLRICICIFIIL